MTPGAALAALLRGAAQHDPHTATVDVQARAAGCSPTQHPGTTSHITPTPGTVPSTPAVALASGHATPAASHPRPSRQLLLVPKQQAATCLFSGRGLPLRVQDERPDLQRVLRKQQCVYMRNATFIQLFGARSQHYQGYRGGLLVCLVVEVDGEAQGPGELHIRDIDIYLTCA